MSVWLSGWNLERFYPLLTVLNLRQVLDNDSKIGEPLRQWNTVVAAGASDLFHVNDATNWTVTSWEGAGLAVG